MALKVKAKEREMKIGKNPGVYRYVMLPELYSTLDQDKVIKEAALRSGVTEGVMQACWDGAGKGMGDRGSQCGTARTWHHALRPSGKGGRECQ